MNTNSTESNSTRNDMDSWYEDNQHYLMAVIKRVITRLQQHVQLSEQENSNGTNNNNSENEQTSETELEKTIESIAGKIALPAALDNLCHNFKLSEFERDILIMCAAIELDGSFSALCSAAQVTIPASDSGVTNSSISQPGYPTFGLALALLPSAYWSAITPAAALRFWRLIEVGAGDTLTTSPLRIDERILHYLTGLNYLDERLKNYLEPLSHTEPLSTSQLKQSKRIQELWLEAKVNGDWPVIQLCGIESNSKLAVLENACASLNSQAYILNSIEIPSSTTERKSLAQLWQREIMLSQNTLVLQCESTDTNEVISKILSFIANIQGPVVINCRDPLRNLKCSNIRIDINKPITEEQQQLWQHGLAPLADKLNGELVSLVEQFNLGASEIQAATMEVLADPEIWKEQNDTGKILWRACRSQARPAMDDLAQRIKPMASWDDLILPEIQKQTLKQVVAHVHQRRTVYQRWGFANKSNRGLGISALLAGASGTGKTMAAEVLAKELELDLYRIDLSSVVSKYIGETEKNLRRLFDAAESGSAILLFDEADALFGKRSEVKDSHDRYANIEVSYLLQRMESYLGLSILTTNLKNSIDSAFLRRIRFVIQFPFPDIIQRREIWQGIYPSVTPTKNLDINKLAKLSITGGNIRNIALNAAFLAAEENDAVCMSHLQSATRAEYLKLEKPLIDSEINDWITAIDITNKKLNLS